MKTKVWYKKTNKQTNKYRYNHKLVHLKHLWKKVSFEKEKRVAHCVKWEFQAGVHVNHEVKNYHYLFFLKYLRIFGKMTEKTGQWEIWQYMLIAEVKQVSLFCLKKHIGNIWRDTRGKVYAYCKWKLRT